MVVQQRVERTYPLLDRVRVCYESFVRKGLGLGEEERPVGIFQPCGEPLVEPPGLFGSWDQDHGRDGQVLYQRGCHEGNGVGEDLRPGSLTAPSQGREQVLVLAGRSENGRQVSEVEASVRGASINVL